MIHHTGEYSIKTSHSSGFTMNPTNSFYSKSSNNLCQILFSYQIRPDGSFLAIGCLSDKRNVRISHGVEHHDFVKQVTYCSLERTNQQQQCGEMSPPPCAFIEFQSAIKVLSYGIGYYKGNWSEFHTTTKKRRSSGQQKTHCIEHDGEYYHSLKDKDRGISLRLELQDGTIIRGLICATYLLGDGIQPKEFDECDPFYEKPGEDFIDREIQRGLEASRCYLNEINLTAELWQELNPPFVSLSINQ